MMNSNALTIEIEIKETLDEHWQDWFHGLELTAQPGGATRLNGCLRDQAALHGVLERIRDLNLKIVSVRVSENPPTQPESTAPKGPSA